jgi:hypothetical protein
VGVSFVTNEPAPPNLFSGSRKAEWPFMPFRLGKLGDAARAVEKSATNRFLILCFVVLAMLSLLWLWKPLGIWPAAIVVLVTIVLAPAYGLALDIFLAVFQQFAYAGPSDFHLLHGITWSAITVRLAFMMRFSNLHYVVRSPTAMLLSVFVLLVIFYNALPFHSPYYWLDVGLVCSLIVIVAAVVVPGLLPSYLPRLIVVAIFAGVLLTIVFDAAYVYVPLPGLSPLTLHLELPPHYLRLAGLHTNPLASSKFIVVCCCMLAAALARMDPQQTRAGVIATWTVFAITALALVATESKSTIFAFLVSFLIVNLFAFRIETITLRSAIWAAAVGGLFVVTLVLWAVVIAPPVKHYAARAWLEEVDLKRIDVRELAGLPPSAIEGLTAPANPAHAEIGTLPIGAASQHAGTPSEPAGVPISASVGSPPGSTDAHAEPAGAPPSAPASSGSKSSNTSLEPTRAPPVAAGTDPQPGALGVLRKFALEFRIGRSYRISAPIRDPDNPLSTLVIGEETGVPRDCVLCTGQRDLLWAAGRDVIEEHWLIGIGFGAWKRLLGEKLGFPFDHPHFGLLEVWGEFGIVGLAMYLTLIVFLLRRAGAAIRANVEGFDKWFLVGSSMAMLALLFNELFDDTKFFSLSPHSIWVWPLLALQEGFLQRPLTWNTPARLASHLSNRFKYRTAPIFGNGS